MLSKLKTLVKEADLRLYYHVYSKHEESLYEIADQEPTHEYIAMTTSPSDSVVKPSADKL